MSFVGFVIKMSFLLKRVRFLEGVSLIFLDLKVVEGDGKGFNNEGMSDYEGLGLEFIFFMLV